MTRPQYQRLDRVFVTTASYTVTGTILTIFENRAGDTRVVVEFDDPRGLLHIHNLNQLSRIDQRRSPNAPGPDEVRHRGGREMPAGWPEG